MMRRDEVEKILDRPAFVPLRLFMRDGRTIDLPFRHCAVALGQGLLTFKGVKGEHTRRADGYEVLAYDGIDRIIATDDARLHPQNVTAQCSFCGQKFDVAKVLAGRG